MSRCCACGLITSSEAARTVNRYQQFTCLGHRGSVSSNLAAPTICFRFIPLRLDTLLAPVSGGVFRWSLTKSCFGKYVRPSHHGGVRPAVAIAKAGLAFHCAPRSVSSSGYSREQVSIFFFDPNLRFPFRSDRDSALVLCRAPFFARDEEAHRRRSYPARESPQRQMNPALNLNDKFRADFTSLIAHLNLHYLRLTIRQYSLLHTSTKR